MHVHTKYTRYKISVNNNQKSKNVPTIPWGYFCLYKQQRCGKMLKNIEKKRMSYILVTKKTVYRLDE